MSMIVIGVATNFARAKVGQFGRRSNLNHEDAMADNITYFGDPVHATDRDGKPIVVNGRPLLIPENFDLQNEINAARNTARRGLIVVCTLCA